MQHWSVSAALKDCQHILHGLSNPGFLTLFVSLNRLDLELKDHEGSTALWLALQHITMSSDLSVNPFEDDAPVENGTSFDENGFAAQLLKRGSDLDAPDTATGAVPYLVALLCFPVYMCMLLTISSESTHSLLTVKNDHLLHHPPQETALCRERLGRATRRRLFS